MTEATFANARVVARDRVFRGRVHVVDGRIAAVDEGPRVPRGALDCAGDFLIPGLVELHTDVLERHAAPRPGVRWPPVAAVVAHDAQLVTAGITTVLDSLAVGYIWDVAQRAPDPRPLTEAVRAAQLAGLLRAEHFLHMRCEVSTEHVVELFTPYAGDPMVRLVSLMDHTPGQRQFVSLDKYREYNQGRYGLTGDQVEALIAKRLGDQATFAAAHRAAITALCRKHGIVLASHDDATATHVEEAVEAGTAIAEFPTTLEAARAAHAHNLAVLAGAPNLVCGGSHSGNIAAAELATKGLLDILASDYVPASLLHAAFLLQEGCGLSLPAAVATVTLTPARRVGLDDRGEIAPGRRADLVRVRLTGHLPLVVATWRGGVRVG
jgi:alpha-D-ribose 1-methylphosphonate 5-triphosphate diphosphatase